MSILWIHSLCQIYSILKEQTKINLLNSCITKKKKKNEIVIISPSTDGEPGGYVTVLYIFNVLLMPVLKCFEKTNGHCNGILARRSFCPFLSVTLRATAVSPGCCPNGSEENTDCVSAEPEATFEWQPALNQSAEWQTVEHQKHPRLIVFISSQNTSYTMTFLNNSKIRSLFAADTYSLLNLNPLLC